MDLVYFVRVLLKRKWVILGSAVLAAVMAIILTRNEPKSYRSSARISTGFTVSDEIKTNDLFNVSDAELKFNNAINTWTSQSVISLVSYSLILHDLGAANPFRQLKKDRATMDFLKEIDVAAARKVFTEKLETMTVLTSYKPDEKVLLELLDLYEYDYKYLNQHAQIYQVTRTDYIMIDCTTENPDLSAFIANDLFHQFIRYYRNVRSTKSQESIDTLQSMMDKKKLEWEEKTKLLRGEDIVDVTTENTSTLDQITELQREVNQEKSKQTDDYYALRRINQKLGSGIGGGPVSGGDNAMNNEELLAARKAVNLAYDDYLKTNDNEKLARYNQLRAEYEKKYAASSSSAPDKSPDNSKTSLLEKKTDLESEIEASREKEKVLEGKIAALRQSVSSVTSKGANVSTLLEEARLTEKDYFDAKQKYQAALDISASSTNNFRQIQVAQPAIEPEPSKRMIKVGMAGAVTFLAVTLIIIFVTYLDSTLRTPGIFARTVKLRLISMVNFMEFKNEGGLMAIVTSNVKEVDNKEKKRNNVFRESIRKLRYEVENSGSKIFLFTSTKKGQGKTTLIQAVSYSLSMSKRNILIIDTNFSNNDLTVQMNADPVLEKMSSVPSNTPLVDKVKAFARDIRVNDSAGHIFVIGSEGGDYTPSEILPRENLLSNLHSLLESFDYIFLEGPPLNDFSDSKELVRYVDGVVAIFSAGATIRQIDQESIAFFNELNGKFCGSVLNKIDLENVNTK